MIHNDVNFARALRLRREGRSYSYISHELGVPKSTLSNWLSREVWSQEVSRQNSVEQGIRNAGKIALLNARRQKLLEEKYRVIKQSAQEDFLTLSQNPLFLLGLALYWGEGDKAHNGRVSVINSDPDLLRIAIAFYRKVLQVEEEKIRAGIFIYEDHEPIQAREYWSRTLDLDPQQFIKTQILPSRSRNTKRRTENGMCSVYFSSTAIRIRIQTWTEMLKRYSRK